MVYNGILMEIVGISVMVSIGLLLLFLAGIWSQIFIGRRPNKNTFYCGVVHL